MTSRFDNEVVLIVWTGKSPVMFKRESEAARVSWLIDELLVDNLSARWISTSTTN
jgi:hypothetical protein